MNAQTAYRQGLYRLMQEKIPEASACMRRLMAHVMNQENFSTVLDGEKELGEDIQDLLESLISRRMRGEPVQYIVGSQGFFKHVFLAEKDVLIPRTDTETLCEAALVFIKNKRTPHVLDVGTGAGILAISIALERPDAHVSAVDISPHALALARRNAAQLGAQIALHQGDMLLPVQEQRFDLILSNPPYIPTQEIPTLMREVKAFEPHLALDGGLDGLDYYRILAKEGPKCLLPNGAMMMEVGQGQAPAVCALFENSKQIKIIEDTGHIQRVIEVIYG